MRTIVLLASIVLSIIAHAGTELYCLAENVETVDGSIRLARVWDRAFYDDFEGDPADWSVTNYENKLSIGLDAEGRTGRCLRVANLDASGDTAFELTSRRFPVTAGTPFRLQIQWRSNMSLTLLSGHKGLYMTQLQWLGADEQPTGSTPFVFGEGAGRWETLTLLGKAPETAVAAVIRIGCDNPNLSRGDYLSIEDVALDAPTATPAHVLRGMMVSRPIRVDDGARHVSWDAETPAGTSITLHVASAPDVNGSPGAWSWSEPPGADATQAAALGAPGPLPAPHAGRPWVRYAAVLASGDPAVTPTLRSVTIDGTTDGPWTGPDVTPPAITGRSASRTADAAAPIWFTLSDETGVDVTRLVVELDGEDITAQLAVEDGRFTYTPREPLVPPGPEAGMSRWRVTNYQQALTITQTVSRADGAPPGFHVTRLAGQTDTSFALRSPAIPVQAGADYTLAYWSRHSMDLPADGPANAAAGRLTWLAVDGTEVGESVALFLGAANPEWRQQALTTEAPEGAQSAVISFGFDTPNIFDGGFFDISEVELRGPAPERATNEPNLHRLDVRAPDFAGNELSQRCYILVRPVLTRNVVTLRDDGVVLIDGEPFFPIGLYAVWKKGLNDNSFDRAFADMRAAGFNLAHTYSSRRGEDFGEFYAAAARHDIKLYVASDAGANSMSVENFIFDVVREESQPALLAWYLADDTAGHVGAGELAALSKAIREIDPAHITVQADAVGTPPQSRYIDYVNSTDGFLPELYPIRGGGADEVPRIITNMETVREDIAARADGPRTIWPIIQYFEGWGWPRFPTRAELWAMSYLSIIHGGHGITWYTYGGWGDNHGVTHTPETWANICELAGEFSYLADWLVERTGPQPAAPEVITGPATDAAGHSSVSILLKEHDGRRCLLAANSSASEVTARMAIGEAGTLTLPFEGRSLKAEGGELVDTFGPYGVHVYTWGD